MRLIIPSVLILLLSACSLPYIQELVSESPAHIASSAVAIMGTYAGSPVFVGSGTYVRTESSYAVLTATHVILDTLAPMYACHDDVTVVEDLGTCTALDLTTRVNSSEGWDVTLVPVSEPFAEQGFLPTVISMYDWSIGEPIWITGYPDGIFNIYLDVISACDSPRACRTAAPTYWGSSGGGIFNYQGKLVGVMTGMYTANHPISGHGIVPGSRTFTLIPETIATATVITE